MRIGLFLPTVETLRGPRWLPSWTELLELAQLAEQAGFDTLFVPDHLIFRASAYWGLDDGASRGAWEAWTILAALGVATHRVEIGTFVTASSLRQPGMLAKLASTLDEISGGRLIMGLGSGSHQAEHVAFGYPFDHLASRFDEALQILVPLLREGSVDFSGRYYRAEACELLPRGPRAGGPPIWIAAFGPRLMRLTARWADGFITAWHTQPSALAAPFSAMEAACQEVGRDPATITRAIGTFVVLDQAAELRGLRGSPEQIANGLRAFGDAGANHVTVMLTPPDRRGIERFARVIELLHE